MVELIFCKSSPSSFFKNIGTAGRGAKLPPCEFINRLACFGIAYEELRDIFAKNPGPHKNTAALSVFVPQPSFRCWNDDKFPDGQLQSAYNSSRVRWYFQKCSLADMNGN